MAGKKKKTVKTRPKSQKKAKRRSGRKNAGKGGGMGNMKMAKAICSITDPFCKAAIGSKYPDVGSLKTLAWDMENWVTISTDASGRGAYFFSPDPGAGMAFATAYAGVTNTVTTTLAASQYPGWSNWASAQGVQWRVVSFGVEARSVLSAMNNQGSVGILAIPPTSSSLPTPQTDLDANTYAVNKRVSCSESKAISAISYNDGFISKEFKYASAGVANQINALGNDVLVVYIAGGPVSAAAVQVRVVAHYELTFGSATVFNTIATPMATHSDAIETGANYVKRNVEQVIIGGAKEVEKQVESAAEYFGKFVASHAPGALESLAEMLL